MAHFQGFWELAWANMRHKWLKIAVNHLFEHPKWSGNSLGKSFLTTFGGAVHSTGVHLGLLPSNIIKYLPDGDYPVQPPKLNDGCH